MILKDKLQQYIDSKGINTNEFERSIGASKSYWRNTKNISADVFLEIIKRYPDININWLINDNGPMLKTETSSLITPQQPSSKNVIKYFPAVNGSMGGIQFLDDPDESSTDIILPGFSECKFAINAYGDSMHPVIKSGQVVILMEWEESFIDWGRIYMIVTKSGYRAIKYLKPSEKEGCIKCESENKEFNPAFDVEVNDIHKLFLVKGWVCRDVI